MEVQLKDNVFEATQWFKDGDHPAVYQSNCVVGDGWAITTAATEGDEYGCEAITPGDWIVEMYDGIHLYSEEEFRELFMNATKLCPIYLAPCDKVDTCKDAKEF